MRILNEVKDLKSFFSAHSPSPLGLDGAYGILIPLMLRDGAWHVLFEVRAHTLRAQPGEVCFPGGRCEAGESPQDCALRETCEELGIPPETIEILGPSDYLLSPFKAILYPYVAVLHLEDLSQLRPNPSEVAEVFAVPLAALLEQEPETHLLETQVQHQAGFPYHKIQKGEAYPWRSAKHTVTFYEYGHRIIWGLTATLLQGFLKLAASTLPAQ